jgi:hypothetical protein
MDYRCYQIILRLKHFNTSREWCKVFTGYLSLRHRSGGAWAKTSHWTERFIFIIFSSIRKQWQPSYCHISCRIAFLDEAFIRNIKILLLINYIIITCINNNNNNNAVINSSHGRLQGLVWLFKIPMGTRKNFFKICRQFGQAPALN